MADSKITALTALTAADPVNDMFPVVDVSDTTMAASGTTKKISVNNILGASGTATLASATITGDLTVDTSTLKVDSTNNRVGIGTASPLYPLHLVGEFGLEEASAGNGTKLRLIGDASKYNFRLGKQLTATNTFEITPSTAIGGTTFSNPVYTVTYDGTHTFLDGAGGTRMTLNSTGLGIGIVGNSNSKLSVYGTGDQIDEAATLSVGNTAVGGMRIYAGVNNTNEYVYIGSVKSGTGYRSLILQPNGGNLGVGVTTFGTSANKVLGLGTGTEPTTGPAGTVQLFTSTRSASNTIPAIFTEGSGVTNAAITNTTVTNKIAIKVNGTIYYLLATTSAA